MRQIGSQQRGLSLIELLIAILIAGILVLAAMPFTGAWVHTNQVHQGKSTLVQAWGQAKAMALRNPKKVSLKEPAAELELMADGALRACVKSCATATEPERWKIHPPPGVVVKFTDPTVTSVFVSNLGYPMQWDGTHYQGLNQVKYEISKESEKDDGFLY